MTTPRELLTRYKWTEDGMEGSSAGEWVLQARDQAREAAIRELIGTWREADTDGHAHDPAVAFSQGLIQCADDLEALLTPPQEREPQ